MRVKTAILISATMMAIAVPSHAQDAPSSAGEPIIVTAQKRSQTLIEVPQSITVVDGSLLEDQHADSFQDYLVNVPGLQLDQSRAGQGRLIIRGVNTEGVASTVGVYVDETPFGSSSGLVNGAVLAGDFDTFDIERIEVLRGPQGTFYGASSLSGVLKFVTNTPSTAGVEARGRVGLETTDGGEMSYYGNAVVNLPLSDMAAFRASGVYRDTGGFIDSIGTAGSDVEENINDSKSYGGRASLLLMPTEAIDLRLTAIVQNIRADAPSLVLADPDTLEILPDGLTQAQYTPSFSDLDYRVYNATGDFDLGFGTLTSSTSYSTQKQDLRTDYTFALGGLIEAVLGVPNDFFQDQSTDSEKFTQELRLAGSASMVDWLIGAYYTEEDGLIQQDFVVASPGTVTPIDGLPATGFAEVVSDYREIAAFANVTLHIGERFDIDIGGRYSDNEQSATQTTDGILAGGFAEFPTYESSEDVFTYSVAPRFELSPDASIFARVAKGFRPGGPNVLPPGAPAEFATYGSDSVVSYEVGFKAQTPDRGLSFDVAAFYIDWDDIQLLAIQDGFGFNANGGSARSKGIEFAATAQPVGGLSLTVNGAYTDAELTADTQIGGFDGDRLPFTPEFSAALIADYNWEVSSGVEASVGGSLRHVSEQSASFDEAFRTANGRQRLVDGYDVVDLRAGVDFGQVALDFYVKNLGNSQGRTSTTAIDVFGGFPLYPGGAIATGVLRPRTFGVSLTAGI
ncbi:TonB-dependent receptor [Aurantiacibacter zhengii]|uniref:TonB-dependent receptor n=1 Tax=Aurantiacibacter zhengii TaxID=2307003 RepID=A0A418NQT7_9SPHN|nr:TonB-dependent receptor [Aurantiacibacter zhengii]RIV84997.1 TonB-dependent receptor [Aurantiacibacter zhengii]